MASMIKPYEVYTMLKEVAKEHGTIYYSDVLNAYGIDTFPNTVKNELTDPILNPLIQYNIEKDQPILSSLVVNKKQNLPGKGFFHTIELMFDIEIADSIDRKAIYSEELDLIWNFDWDLAEWDADKWDKIICRKKTTEHKNPSINFEDLINYLACVANKRKTVTYKQVLDNFGLQLNPNSVGLLVRKGLDPLITYNIEHNEPILSSLVVRNKSGIPGPGFFRKMQLTGKYEGSIQGKNAITFHKKELEKVWNHYVE